MRRAKFAVVAALFVSLVSLHSSLIAQEAILLEFSSRNCGPCRAMQPVVAEVEQSGVPVRRVDVDREPHLALRYSVRQTPTYIVINGGKEVTRLMGSQSVGQLVEALRTNPAGPLIPTEMTRRLNDPISAPRTRLAPVRGGVPLARQPNATTRFTSTTDLGFEEMPSRSMADAIEKARAATVRLRVHDDRGYGAGTGTIIDTHGEEALVMTCGHLFRDTQGKGKIEVDLFVGGQARTVTGTLVDYDADARDIALVAVRPGMAVTPVQVIAAGESVANGSTAFSFGCDRGDDPSRRDTRITGVNKYNQHINASNLEIAGAPIDGRSGGGLFDERGRLIGVCNSADYKGDVGIYTGPGSIHWQLDRVKLAHLYESPAGDRSLVAQASAQAPLPTASIDTNVIPAGLPMQEPATAPTFSISDRPQGDQEVIVIFRDRSHPNASPRVKTLMEPSPALMQMIEQSR
ncbi:MAG: trypsin-like peptidase domain-containing protein [Planctomycetota bacterium]